MSEYQITEWLRSLVADQATRDILGLWHQIKHCLNDMIADGKISNYQVRIAKKKDDKKGYLYLLVATKYGSKMKYKITVGNKGSKLEDYSDANLDDNGYRIDGN